MLKHNLLRQLMFNIILLKIIQFDELKLNSFKHDLSYIFINFLNIPICFDYNQKAFFCKNSILYM